MKRLNIFSLLTGCLLLASCAEEDFRTDPTPKIIEGMPVTATFTFRPSENKQLTKATPEEENRVNDLYVLVFTKEGKFSTAQYFSSDSLASLGGNRVKVTLLSGKNYIYAAANVTANSFTREGVDLKTEIDAFTQSADNTLDDWKAQSATMSAGQVTWGDARFLMTGFFAASAANGDELPGDGSCVVTENGTIATSTPGQIQLVRTVSSFTFNIKTAGDKVVSFIPTSWQVVNAPMSVYLHKQAGAGTPGDVFSTIPQGVSNNSFSFYLLENRQQAKTSYEGAMENTYAEADWRENPANYPENGKATYIVLKGKYTGWEANPLKEEFPVEMGTGEVTYFIHLGYINAVDDYSALRNHKYTYNITIQGAEKIIIEGNVGEETHRADGDIRFADADVLSVDAHYNRLLLNFEAGTEVNDFLCGIQTAKTGFQYEDVNTLKSDGQDTDWVLFMEKAAADALPNGPVFTAGSRSAGLMTIQELSAAFKENAFGSEDVSFYAYIAENYYTDLPLYSFVNYSATEGENKSRMMLIALTRSQGGNSSVSSAKYVIKQKPITSIYNMASDEVADAQTFGIEWVNENLPEGLSLESEAKAGLEYGSTARNRNEKWNGLGNMKQELKDNRVTSWQDTDINPDNPTRAKAYAACMSRNRDENGNGRIDDNEIKWYLPAINQYQYLWTGTDALPEEARLYPAKYRNARKWEFYHFASAGGDLYWAEEGNAVSLNLNEYADPRLGYGKYHIRCARNLGKGASLQIAEKTTDNRDYIVLEVNGRLTQSSLRSKLNSQMSLHNEYEDNNKLYPKIQVAKTLIKVNDRQQAKDWKTTAAAVNGKDNPCVKKFGPGWRAPSQREMILFTTVGGLTNSEDGGMFASTYYSFWDYENDREFTRSPANQTRTGFSFSNGYMTLMPDGKQYIRCVKDIE